MASQDKHACGVSFFPRRHFFVEKMADKSVKLTSSDGRLFVVNVVVAKQSQTIESMMPEGISQATSPLCVCVLTSHVSRVCADLGEDDMPIPLPNVTGDILEKVHRRCCCFCCCFMKKDVYVDVLIFVWDAGHCLL